VSACEIRVAWAVVEAALDHAGWPWAPRLSRWLDALPIREGRGE
jgi:hypothetical protein